MKDTTYKWCSEHRDECFNSKGILVFRVLSNSIEVHYGRENDCNIEYCQENNIPLYNLGRCGGTIVCCNGTIGYAMIYDVEKGWMNYLFVNAFTEFLKNKGLNTTNEGNDILVDGYKVASAAELRVTKDLGRIFGVYLISYDVDLNAINKICLKEMKKHPKGLKDFGITKDEILNWSDNFFTNIENNYK